MVSFLTLIVEAAEITEKNLTKICNLDLPSLEYFELWLGRGKHYNINIDILAPILSGKSFPNLLFLAIRGTANTSEIAQAITKSPILNKLRVLELTDGNLTNIGAIALLKTPAVNRLHTLDVSIKTWDLHSCKELSTLFSKGYSRQSTYALCIIPTGKILISGGHETIQVWDLCAKREVWKLEGHSHVIKSLAISPDRKTLVSDSDQRIKVWDIQLGQEIFSFYGHADWVRSIVFSPDGQSFITAGDTKIKIWDVATGKKLHSFQAHDDVVSSLALSYDGATLVSGSYDGTVKIWRS